ncbi:UDP-N-acetylmuramate dehydrogenase [Oceanicoccus sagamiensis]|uniref:UDP-N-acetylenolpyruvoylglucosamine reductase n=1 Tax=Oceanicoccus sagamiensis TaxID=716816 RepID=A0A1X9NLX9_9GAMM|nr:UDP-N-acetylmuramate dehydrogenase [Oceanicoccus sagamiensis]ARN75837.1 UDP-N-acetylenolpyruvoylglucosamine reductase [Oceanicoccus sagamiensis]
MTLLLRQNADLQPLNTLAVPVRAKFLAEIHKPSDVIDALELAQINEWPVVFLGGGSNMLLTQDIDGLAMHCLLKGICAQQQGDTVLVTAQAGESWQGLVEYCLQQGYYGIENLSLIPGTVGAAPIQNIGAYGVELEQVFESVEGWDIEQQQWRTLSASDCQFSYRNSIFKQQLKQRFFISAVTLRLSLNDTPNLSYGVLQQHFKDLAIPSPSARQVAQAVIAIRQSKLPDPAVLANAGSFFKNPIISQQQQQQLSIDYPDMVCYPQPDGRVKVAAGWLLEQAGWKGKTIGPVGMHEQQALVLINYQQGDGQSVLALAEAITQDIAQRFAIHLEIEPQVY